MTSETILSLKEVDFSYRLGSTEHAVVKRLNMSVHRGEMIAIQGPSGSGKSTLFYLIGCMLKPSKGEILFGGQDVLQYDELALAQFRNRHIGFIFQQFHLLSRATVLQNILLPTQYPAELLGTGICQLGIWAGTKFVKGLKFEFVFEPFALFISVAAMLVVGILSGLAPARKAEKLSVIEALRSE